MANGRPTITVPAGVEPAGVEEVLARGATLPVVTGAGEVAVSVVDAAAAGQDSSGVEVRLAQHVVDAGRM